MPVLALPRASSLLVLVLLVAPAHLLRVACLRGQVRAILAAPLLSLALVDPALPAMALSPIPSRSSFVLSQSREVDFNSFLSLLDDGKLAKVVFKGTEHRSSLS